MQLGQTDGTKRVKTPSPALPADLEVAYQDSESSDDDKLVYPAEARDVFNLVQVKSILDTLNDITPLEALNHWPSKSTKKNSVKKEPMCVIKLVYSFHKAELGACCRYKMHINLTS